MKWRDRQTHTRREGIGRLVVGERERERGGGGGGVNRKEVQ